MPKLTKLTDVERQLAAITLTLADVRAERAELRKKVRYLEQRHEKMTAEAAAARLAAREAQNRASKLRNVNEDLKASRAHCRALEAELARVIRAAAVRTTSEEDTTEE